MGRSIGQNIRHIFVQKMFVGRKLDVIYLRTLLADILSNLTNRYYRPERSFHNVPHEFEHGQPRNCEQTHYANIPRLTSFP